MSMTPWVDVWCFCVFVKVCVCVFEVVRVLHPQYEMQSLKENGATEAEGTLNKWSESGALRKELSRLREHYRKMQDQSTSARFQKFSWFISEKDGILTNGYGGCWAGTTHYSRSCWYTCVNFVGFGGHLIWKKRKDIKFFRKIEDPKRLQLCFNV